MRLFIAAEVPEDVKHEAAALRDRMGHMPGIKWVEKGNMHLTLRFLGEVEERAAAGVRQALRGVSFQPFEARAAGFGAFPSESRPRVLWIGLEPADRISSLHGSIDAALLPLGFPPDDRFSPHMTIGRVRDSGDAGDLAGKIRELKQSASQLGKPFQVAGFVLKSSTLTPRGPVYADLESFGAVERKSA